MTPQTASKGTIKPQKEQFSISKEPTRSIIAFPRIHNFYNTLMDRFHMVLKEFFLERKFTILINAMPRDHEPGTIEEVSRYDNISLIYAGIRRQRFFLEGPKQQRKTTLDEFWNRLDSSKMVSEKAVVSSGLFKQFKEGSYSLKEIKPTSLQGYFDPMLKGEEDPAPNQEDEYAILQGTLKNLKKYHYISIPLIQFAEFDGVIHIVFHKKELKKFVSKKSGKVKTWLIGNIIKAFSREYEGLILDWDLVQAGEYLEEAFLDALSEKIYYSLGVQKQAQKDKISLNPILEELKYFDYYKLHQAYFQERITQKKKIPLTIRDRYNQIAIMSILIDSYAHNISAHSLTALEWWFKQRAEIIEKREKSEDTFIEDYTDLEIVRSGRPLDSALHPFLRFLLDKGAFWTGLTRSKSFGGKISSLFSVLWYDFIHNPLYLGTIAFSEGILKLNINITILKTENTTHGIRFRKKVEADGCLASIDLSQIMDPNRNPIPEQISEFVTPGAEFHILKEFLQKYRAFFPGGVVGRHAFFTILENEIRNVKHYPEEEIKQMQEHGLTLNISIEEDGYDEEHKAAYYKVGTWIKNPVKIGKELMLRRLELLQGEIITEKTYRPRLGGIFQDKVCAAMLFNNSFSAVQDKDGPKANRFYPWVKVGSCANLHFKTGDIIEEIEVSARKYYEKDFEESKVFFDNYFEPQNGYYKKFFHIWQGEHLYSVKDNEQITNIWENLSRFRFVYLLENKIDGIRQVREAGIIRILNQKPKEQQDAYNFWLQTWLKNKIKQNHQINFYVTGDVKGENGQLAAVLNWDGKKASFFNYKQFEESNKQNGAERTKQDIYLLHGTNKSIPAGLGVCRYRTHGILKQHYCAGKRIHQATMSSELAAELLEVLASNVCIYDNRIANRLEKLDRNIYQKGLKCSIYKEQKANWELEKKKGFDRFHFLVVHLSFIEKFVDENGEKYKEDDISNFILNEVLQGQAAKKNFMLIITTGRGRTQWWDRLLEIDQERQEEYKKENVLPFSAFVSFRPVESIIAAVENSLSMKDDIELKYRLVKTLFGS